MISRRGFLAAVGTGVSALAFGGTASAWGWRRRRCCPVYCPTPCPQVCPELLTTGTCDYGCVDYCYGVVNGMYQYHCYCCASNNTQVDSQFINTASKTAYAPASGPNPCANASSKCIPLGAGYSGEKGEPPFQTAADSEILQFKAPAKPTTKFEPRDGVLVSEDFIRYKDGDGKTRYAKVFEVRGKGRSILRSGLEVTKPSSFKTGGLDHPHGTAYHAVKFDQDSRLWYVLFARP
jgi:hypothetical protein